MPVVGAGPGPLLEVGLRLELKVGLHQDLSNSLEVGNNIYMYAEYSKH